MSKLTHFDDSGAARMVDVGAKPVTARTATASAVVQMATETADLIRQGRANKGDVLGIARVAGIMAAKKTSDLIPLCHPLPLTTVQIEFEWLPEAGLKISATAKVDGKTGVEMEALTAVTISALTVYDMCKAVDRGMTISEVRLDHKAGGSSGDFRNPVETQGQ